MAKQLTRDDLTADRAERVYREITLPPPNPAKSREPVSLWVRSMFGCEYLDLINSLTDDRGRPIEGRQGNLGALMVAFCWVDGDGGKRVLSDEDVLSDWWKRKHAAFTADFIAKVREHNGVGLGEALEDERKNLPATTSSDSSTE
jgi:hypothetical protein